MTSEHYDAPQALGMVAQARRVVAVRGRKDAQRDETDGVATWVGGRDTQARGAVIAALAAAKFAAEVAPRLTGTGVTNICNRGLTGRGVQLEIPKSLRDRLVRDPNLMARYGAAVRRGSV